MLRALGLGLLGLGFRDLGVMLGFEFAGFAVWCQS